MTTEEMLYSLSKGEPGWLIEQRKKFLSLASNMEEPSFKYGMGIFAKPERLDLEDAENKDNSFVVKGDVEVLSFSEAWEKHKETLQEYLFKDLDLDKIGTLQAALFSESVFIRIPKNKALETPIMISLDLKSSMRDYIFILAEEGSEATIFETAQSGDELLATRKQIVRVLVENGACVNYCSYQNLGKDVSFFSRRYGHVKRDASLHWLQCHIGSNFTQSNTKSSLLGEGARSKTWAALFGDKKQCFDVHDQSVHESSYTHSDMLTKIALHDKAKTVYRGLVKVQPNAKGCEGYQKDDTLLLSEEAHADAVPILEIHNDDVQCSHGATVTQIDDEKLFYLLSRGIDKETATKAFVEGFFEPIISAFSKDSFREKIHEQLHTRIERMKVV